MKLKVREITNPIDVKIGMKAVPAHLIDNNKNHYYIGKIFERTYSSINNCSIFYLQFEWNHITSYQLHQLRFIIENDPNIVCKKHK